MPLEHVARIWSRDLTCYGEVPCRFIKIQLGSAESDVNSMEGFSKDPELVGHDYELAFRLTDYLPVYFRQTDRYHVGIVAAAIYHGYRFDRPIDAVELPASGEMTQSEAIPPLVAQTEQLSNEPVCTLPAYLVRKRVQYPLEAIMQRQSGKTVIQLIVQADGTPVDLTILSSSGFNLLDNAALAAVKEYRFTPKKCNEKAVTSPALVPVLFDVKPVDPGAIKFGQDNNPLEREDVDQEIAFLNAQRDIQKVVSEEGDIYFDQANYSVWLIRRDADSNQRILVRIRAEHGGDILYQNYATLCDGSSDWCSAQLDFCLDLVQQSPIPAIEQNVSE